MIIDRFASNEIVVHHHLGLGDHLDCNGMIRVIASHPAYSKVYIFSKIHHFEMINYMYRDNEKINVVPINPDDEYGEVDRFMKKNPYRKIFIVGHEYYDPMLEKSKNLNCWQQFYMQAGIPTEDRWNQFYFKRDEAEEQRVFKKLNPTAEPYIFLHDDPDRGFIIDRDKVNPKGIKIIENDTSESIFHYVKIIKNAKEVHCMESSFKSLVELIRNSGDLYFHDFRGHPLGNDSARAGWVIINYDN